VTGDAVSVWRFTATSGGSVAVYETRWFRPKMYPEEVAALLVMAQNKAEVEEGFDRSRTWWQMEKVAS
jgi:hypothetical protein